MRIYGTKTVPASIRQKNDVGLKYGKPARPLTADDFEIVPEHEEEQLIEVRCELCGIAAEYVDPRTIEGEDCESSLISIQLWTARSDNDCREVTGEFLKDYWYEVCEACMKDTIVPTLMCLSGSSLPGNTEQAEDRGNAPLPPLSEDEPF
jgi:hypothetical protein